MQFFLGVTECAATPLPTYRYVLFEWSLISCLIDSQIVFISLLNKKHESNSNRGIVSGFAGATRAFDVKILTLISLLVISRA